MSTLSIDQSSGYLVDVVIQLVGVHFELHLFDLASLKTLFEQIKALS